MDKILADTSAWIASFYRSGHEPLKETMKEKILNGELVTTGMVLLELLQGAKNDEQYESFRKKISILPVVSVDDSCWTKVARLVLSLRQKGVQVSLPDAFISYVAIENRCLLIHCDSDFERIKKHTTLRTLPF